jgi:hypothetical protein
MCAACVGCCQQEAELRCRALEFYTDSGSYNTDYLATCRIYSSQRPECLVLNCVNFGDAPIGDLELRPMACGDGGRQGMFIRVFNQSTGLDIFMRTFYETSYESIGEETFKITVEQLSVGVRFGVSGNSSDIQSL